MLRRSVSPPNGLAIVEGLALERCEEYEAERVVKEFNCQATRQFRILMFPIKNEVQISSICKLTE